MPSARLPTGKLTLACAEQRFSSFSDDGAFSVMKDTTLGVLYV